MARTSDSHHPKTIDGKDLLDRVTANPIDDHFKNLAVFWERIAPDMGRDD